MQKHQSSRLVAMICHTALEDSQWHNIITDLSRSYAKYFVYDSWICFRGPFAFKTKRVGGASGHESCMGSIHDMAEVREWNTNGPTIKKLPRESYLRAIHVLGYTSHS